MLRKFVRSGKNDDVVRKVDLIEANPMYARIRYPDGKESNVSLRDLARCPIDDEEGSSRPSMKIKENPILSITKKLEPNQTLYIHGHLKVIMNNKAQEMHQMTTFGGRLMTSMRNPTVTQSP